ncbi:protein kinase [Streptomyces filamentosus]|uniref:serine/threonine-protein kinase n=1 Tax=Streptomyces filamentosus TaxID=67294 RepID=UPI0035F4DD73
MEHSQSTGSGLLLAGRYRLGESIGRGGMGKVWKAHDEVLHRVVAVKELTAGRFVAEADRLVLHARTQKEARAAARITHPGVVTVHDVLEHDDRPWIVMQFVDGPSLADAVKESGTITPHEAARVGLHVVGALRAAHSAGVLHRDVKPGNVLLARDGRVLITDFGIAAIEGDSTITRTGELVGSIDYLAPERVQGSDPGPASDLWSLGATLYTAVEGTSPFRRTSPISTMQAVVGEEPPYPEKAGPLAPVIVALLRKDPRQRPRADEVGRMLLDAMEGRSPETAQAYVPTQRMDREATEALERGRAGVPEAVTPPRTAPGNPPTAQWPEAGRTPAAPYPSGSSHPSGGPASSPPTLVPGSGSPGGPGNGSSGGKGRWRTAVLTAVLGAVVAGGAVFAVMQYAGPGGSGPGPAPTTSVTGTGTEAGTAGPDGKEKGVAQDVPAGWRRVEDPAGFSLIVPEGWKRQTDGDTSIDYTPDGGRHRLRISIDKSPDFENPYLHLLDLEKTLQKRMDYRRVWLNQNSYRDQVKAGLWKFTWTEKQNFPGPRHAIDQMYFDANGTEYAIYMASPEESWDTTREQFDIVLQHWRAPGA